MRHAKKNIGMIKYLIFILVFISALANGQTIKLTDYLIYPRLDSAYWNSDFDLLNVNSSDIANRCQTCVFTESDTTRSRFCFNTSLGHVQMDTTIHDFPVEKLIGKWTVISFGTIETTDSLLPDTQNQFRNQTILNEQNNDLGMILFTDKRMKTEFKNIKDIPNQNKGYKILDGKFLTTKKFFVGYCGATFIGLTQNGFLIIDDHTYRTLARYDQYLLVKTNIRRIILKK
jgi:hypothetical protein